jgi:hypothetical protein
LGSEQCETTVKAKPSFKSTRQESMFHSRVRVSPIAGAKLKHMKITYEPGDIVEVEDNSDAGVFAACTIELSHYVGDCIWIAEFKDCIGGKTAPDIGSVHERYLQP